MVKGHLCLRCCHLFFCNFRWFSIRAAIAHYPVIQIEVDELLAKGAIESSTCGAGFYSNAFVVPKCTGGLQPILNLKWFNCYMHIPAFKMPNIRQEWWVFQQGKYAFSIDLKDAYLDVPIVKHHHQFLHCIHGRFFHLGWLWPLWFSLHLLNPYCSFAKARVFTLLYIWMISWSWLTQSMLAREHESFCSPYWLILDYI